MRNVSDWIRYAIVGLLLSGGCGLAAAASDGAKQAQAERRQKSIEQCLSNRGAREDCERQADVELGKRGFDKQQSQGDERRGGGR